MVLTRLVHGYGSDRRGRRLIGRRLDGHRAADLGLQRLVRRSLAGMLHGPGDEAAGIHRQAIRDAALRSATRRALLLSSCRIYSVSAGSLACVYIYAGASAGGKPAGLEHAMTQ